ncbi:hypothetical protein Tco_1284177 [Tanacetum coccineum]
MHGMTRRYDKVERATRLRITSDITNSLENQHTTSQDPGMVCMNESTCLLISNSTEYNPPPNDMEIHNAVMLHLLKANVDLPHGISSLQKVEVAYDESVRDELSCGTAIAKVES